MAHLEGFEPSAVWVETTCSIQTELQVHGNWWPTSELNRDITPYEDAPLTDYDNGPECCCGGLRFDIGARLLIPAYGMTLSPQLLIALCAVLSHAIMEDIAPHKHSRLLTVASGAECNHSYALSTLSHVSARSLPSVPAVKTGSPLPNPCRGYHH